MDEQDSEPYLLCHVHTFLCALPLQFVVETMRPLPAETLTNPPEFVTGLALVRGSPIPVVDVARLLGAAETHPTRFVIARTDGRRIAFAVNDVIGVRSIAKGALQALPPLLSKAEAGIVAAIGTLDARLLLILSSARAVPEDLWDRLGAEGAAS